MKKAHIKHGSQWHQPETVQEIRVVYSRPFTGKKQQIKTSKDAEVIFRECFDSMRMDLKEFFHVAFLSRANHVLAVAKIGEGSPTGVVVSVPEIIQLALAVNASGIIIAHNHPSGSLKPSGADIRLTQRVKDAARLFEIALFDHLILTSEGYYSFAVEGALL